MHSTNLVRGYGFKAAAIMLAVVAAAFFAPGITQAHAVTKSTVALSATAKTATVTGSLDFSGTTSTCKDVIPLSPSYKGRISINFKATLTGYSDWVGYEDVNPTIALYESERAGTAAESKGLYGCASASGLNFEPTTMLPSWMDVEASGKGNPCIRVGCDAPTTNKNRKFDYTLTITYTPYADVTINYLNKADNSNLVASETVTVPMGVAYKATAKSVGNYTVDSSAKSITPGSSTNTITFYYTKNAGSGYTGDDNPVGLSWYDPGYNGSMRTNMSSFHNCGVKYSGYFTSGKPDEVWLLVNGVKTKQINADSDKWYTASYNNSKATPGKKYTFEMAAFKDGYKVSLCSDSITVNSFGKATCKATKISANKAIVRVEVPAYMANSRELKIKIYKGAKLVKTITSTSKCTYKYTCTKKGAGKAKYKVVLQSNVNGVSAKSTSNTVKKPGANTLKYSPSKYMSSYGQTCRIKSVSYSGSYLVIKGYFINNRIVNLSNIVATVGVTCDGKIVGKKTINSGHVGYHSYKSFTVKVKAKKVTDIRFGYASASVNTYKY